MNLETLAQVNVERAARRPVFVVTDVVSGEQRLVKAADLANDPLRNELAKQLRMTWHFARPPVIDLEFEMDCRRVMRESVI